MNIGFQFRNEISGLPGGSWIVEQIDLILAGISGTWGVDHLDNGRHGNVRADSYRERGRSIAVGEWETVPFAASRFTTNATAWTVVAGTQDVYKVMLIGMTMFVAFSIENTNVTGAGNELRIALPSGYISARRAQGSLAYSDAGSAQTAGVCDVTSDATYIRLFRSPSANWTATAANDTTVRGFIAIEVIES
jgi:hypothetical protein